MKKQTKNRFILRYTTYFFVAIAIGVSVAFTQFVNLKQFDWKFGLGSKNPTAIQTLSSQCQPEPPINLANTGSPYLQKLDQYQQLCGSRVANKFMIFTSMPNSKQTAQKLADRMAVDLKSFAEAGVTPVVIVEPTTDWGLIDFKEFGTGFYDQWIKDYFAQLKKQGLSDEQMGIWVPFPEANLPYWNRKNATPQDFAGIVNRYVTSYKGVFPKAKASILLNSATYESDDFDWARGEYSSLLPYVSGITPGLVDSFGLQGFPWTPAKDQGSNGIFDAREFLNHDLAIEAAKKLGVREIWYNSGTFVRKYTQDELKMVTITAEKRKDTGYGIVNEAMRTRDAGFSVWVNIFAEDKSAVAEATDWSYLVAGRDHQQVFHDILARLSQEKIGVSLYDVKK